MAIVQLHDIATEADQAAVLALRRGPGQERYLGSMESHFEDAVTDARACPRMWSVHDEDLLVGFVMISDGIPAERLAADDDLVGPYFLWRLLIDERHQRHGYGRATLDLIVDLVRAEGATELLTSYQPGDGGPWPFYEKFGFRPTGEIDGSEILIALDLSVG
jgi:diamine N-acetyltransferase